MLATGFCGEVPNIERRVGPEAVLKAVAAVIVDIDNPVGPVGHRHAMKGPGA